MATILRGAPGARTRRRGVRRCAPARTPAAAPPRPGRKAPSTTPARAARRRRPGPGRRSEAAPVPPVAPSARPATGPDATAVAARRVRPGSTAGGTPSAGRRCGLRGRYGGRNPRAAGAPPPCRQAHGQPASGRGADGTPTAPPGRGAPSLDRRPPGRGHTSRVRGSTARRRKESTHGGAQRKEHLPGPPGHLPSPRHTGSARAVAARTGHPPHHLAGEHRRWTAVHPAEGTPPAYGETPHGGGSNPPTEGHNGRNTSQARRDASRAPGTQGAREPSRREQNAHRTT